MRRCPTTHAFARRPASVAVLAAVRVRVGDRALARGLPRRAGGGLREPVQLRVEVGLRLLAPGAQLALLALDATQAGAKLQHALVLRRRRGELLGQLLEQVGPLLAQLAL